MADEIVELSNLRRVRRQHEPHPAATVRLREVETALGLSLRHGDRVQDDVAVDGAELHTAGDPLHAELDAQVRRQRAPELDLESRRVGRLARERQRVGVGTLRQHAAVADDTEGPPVGGRAGEGGRERTDERGRAPAGHRASSYRLRM